MHAALPSCLLQTSPLCSVGSTPAHSCCHPTHGDPQPLSLPACPSPAATASPIARGATGQLPILTATKHDLPHQPQQESTAPHGPCGAGLKHAAFELGHLFALWWKPHAAGTTSSCPTGIHQRGDITHCSTAPWGTTGATGTAGRTWGRQPLQQLEGITDLLLEVREQPRAGSGQREARGTLTKQHLPPTHSQPAGQPKQTLHS